MRRVTARWQKSRLSSRLENNGTGLELQRPGQTVLLLHCGENVKVVRELMRHGNSRCTLDVHSQARIRPKREAQQRIVEMLLPDDGQNEIKLQRRGPE